MSYWLKGYAEGLSAASNVIEETPAADVVEVVRCKDCISRGTESCAMYYECDYCEEQHTWETDNDFCSYGERKR